MRDPVKRTPLTDGRVSSYYGPQPSRPHTHRSPRSNIEVLRTAGCTRRRAPLLWTSLIASTRSLAPPAHELDGRGAARKPPRCRERRVGAMRRRLPWLIALPVMAAGSIGAHSLSYLLVSARTTEAAGEASERASSGGPSYLVLFL